MAATFTGQRLTSHKAQERVIVPQDAECYVSIVDLAAFLNVSPDTVVSSALRHGAPVSKMRRPGSGQLMRVIAADHAKQVIRDFREQKQIIKPEDLA